jgi:hypothetical protein
MFLCWSAKHSKTGCNVALRASRQQFPLLMQMTSLESVHRLTPTVDLISWRNAKDASDKQTNAEPAACSCTARWAAAGYCARQLPAAHLWHVTQVVPSDNYISSGAEDEELRDHGAQGPCQVLYCCRLLHYARQPLTLPPCACSTASLSTNNTIFNAHVSSGGENEDPASTDACLEHQCLFEQQMLRGGA